MNSQSDLLHGIISERLKYIDVLLKSGRLDDAEKEITSIKGLNSANPYVLAYDERIQSLKASMDSRPRSVLDTSLGNHEENQNLGAVLEQNSEFAEKRTELSGKTQTRVFVHSTEASRPNVVQTAIENEVSAEPENIGKTNIVLVDDDELLMMALVELFQDNGYSISSFAKAEDALQFLRGHKPDLVLCDVNLNKSAFGGFTLLEKMEKLGHLHNVPFIFMSGLNDEAIIRAGKEAGADDYLTKPIEPDMLLSVVKGKLRKYRQIRKNHSD